MAQYQSRNYDGYGGETGNRFEVVESFGIAPAVMWRFRRPARQLTGTYTTPQGHTIYYYDDGTTRYQR